MKLLMIGGDRSILQGKKSAFWYTLQEFSKHWDRIDVICAQADNPQCDQLPDGSYKPMEAEVYFHPCPHGVWYQSLWIAKQGAKIIDEQGASVMTVHEYPPFFNGIGAKLLSKKRTIPYELEIHHIVGHPKPASFTERIGLWMTRLLIALDASTATAVRTVNSAVKDQLASWGVPNEKIQVVPSFYLDTELLSSTGDQEKEYDVAFCARLVPNKGLTEFLQAVANVTGARAVVIGDGPEKEVAQQLVRSLGMVDRVTFTGWLPDQESVIRTIKSAKVFVMNSKSEGGPRVLLEAMGCGMPVIATPVGIAPDVIEHDRNGLLCNGTSEELATFIGELLEDDQRCERLGAEATNVLQRFNRESLVRNYAEFVQSIAT